MILDKINVLGLNQHETNIRAEIPWLSGDSRVAEVGTAKFVDNTYSPDYSNEITACNG